ncbi:MAG: biotin--[acetyl-CoA-carboxylase] ligase [Erythrobacter sp.]
MIHIAAQTGSTNADLLDRIKSGEAIEEGTWLVADRQTDGRGRQGREWFDGHGNFMGSTLVRLGPNDPPAQTLSLMVGIAVYDAVLPLVPDAFALKLKWPNDVLLNGAKLAGILLESEADAIVIGIGVNLRQAPKLEGREAIAIADVTTALERDEFAPTLARGLRDELARWRQYGLEPLLSKWKAVAYPEGTSISVHDGNGEPLAGTYAGLTDTGSLLLRLADGETRAIHAGDVVLD